MQRAKKSLLGTGGQQGEPKADALEGVEKRRQQVGDLHQEIGIALHLRSHLLTTLWRTLHGLLISECDQNLHEKSGGKAGVEMLQE